MKVVATALEGAKIVWKERAIHMVDHLIGSMCTSDEGKRSRGSSHRDLKLLLVYLFEG